MKKRDKPSSSRAAVVIGVTASIAAYKAAGLVSRLVRDGIETRVVMTRDSLNFIRPLTFQSLSRRRVYLDMFDQVADFDHLHIGLADAAAVAVVPATADFIGKVAAGRADDLLSALIMTTSAPVLFAPAMNSGMYSSPIVRENIDRLEKHGFIFVGPEKGLLSCGAEGIGRLAPIDVIADRIKRLLRDNKG